MKRIEKKKDKRRDGGKGLAEAAGANNRWMEIDVHVHKHTYIYIYIILKIVRLYETEAGVVDGGQEGSSLSLVATRFLGNRLREHILVRAKAHEVLRADKAKTLNVIKAVTIGLVARV